MPDAGKGPDRPDTGLEGSGVHGGKDESAWVSASWSNHTSIGNSLSV